jgi:hypothetical protein
MASNKKPSNLEVKKKMVYLNRELTSEEKKSDDPRYVRGAFPEPDMADYPDMADHHIESDDFRMYLEPDEGKLCISIMPGYQEIGELYINIQFEGSKGKREYCMNGQNDLLLNSSVWLKEIVGEFIGHWDVDIAATPCPKTDVKVEVDLAAAILEEMLDVNHPLNILHKKVETGVASNVLKETMNVVNEIHPRNEISHRIQT